MTTRPILFSGHMVRAILAGSKTQTRRKLKFQEWDDAIIKRFPRQKARVPFSVGDLLWVRESWSGEHWLSDVRPAERYGVFNPDRIVSLDPLTWYWADGSPNEGDWERPRPGIHMPRWASRLTLAVTDVRVERLHAISEADAIAEGACQYSSSITLHRDRPYDPELNGVYREGFSELWEGINGPGAWEANPFVVAVSFTAHKCNVDAFVKSEAA